MSTSTVSQTPIPVTGERSCDAISEALSHLVSSFAGLVRRIGREYRFQEAEMDELLQDVRIRLWRNLRSAEHIASVPASYVYRTAVSAAVDMTRRRGRRPEQSLEITSLPDRALAKKGPESRLEDERLGRVIAEALDTLSDSRRPVVRMYLAGYHRNEIAELMGWTEAKTRNLLYRGLGDLRAELIDRGVQPPQRGE